MVSKFHRNRHSQDDTGPIEEGAVVAGCLGRIILDARKRTASKRNLSAESLLANFFVGFPALGRRVFSSTDFLTLDEMVEVWKKFNPLKSGLKCLAPLLWRAGDPDPSQAVIEHSRRLFALLESAPRYGQCVAYMVKYGKCPAHLDPREPKLSIAILSEPDFIKEFVHWTAWENSKNRLQHFVESNELCNNKVWENTIKSKYSSLLYEPHELYVFATLLSLITGTSVEEAYEELRQPGDANWNGGEEDQFPEFSDDEEWA